MFLRGEYTSDNATYGVLMEHTRTKIEILLVLSGTVVSAYKMDVTGSYSYNNNKAKELASTIQAGLKGCTKKRFKGTIPGATDVLHQYEFTKAKTEYIVQLRISDHVKELGGISFQSDNKRASIVYANNVVFPENIPYVKLTEVKTFTDDDSSELDDIQTRSVQEIALEKEDVSWLLKKKYYIIKDDEQAEQLFSQLEQYGGLIAYDTETTGLKMNCYSKIGSKYMADLDKYNTEHPDDQMRADRLVGIIFCVEPDVSYYFPCFNRKFKNLYQDKESPWRKKLINNIRARYTIGDRYNPHSDMYKYITTTPDDELRLDVLLMERVRNILEKKDIATHHGAFEWKVGWCYEIDTNIKEDSMLMHQLMYKFRSTTRNSGEPSNLKYLARVELGIDQWELKDFFPNFKEDKKGTVRRRPGEKKNTNIDFSYMDEEGARVYAPCDGDVTLQLCFKYKTDMLKNHKEIEYLYQVEILVSMAIGYMEFYGHRIDESKILDARLQTQADIAMLTEELRQEINYNNQMEDEAYAAIKAFRDTPKSERNLSDEEYAEQLTQLIDNLNKAISGNAAHVINLSSPAQVGELFYDKLGYPMTGDKKSVDKKTLKALIKEKDENGNLKYPVVKMYRDLKDKETLLSKFFDNLNYFMYIGAGGLIFSSYGQIATATGRMSCNKPNAQQYPKVITKIVVPRPGYVMVDADYSQIEYRVLTALAKNDWLAKLFSDPDSDYHTLMASLMYDVPYSSVTPSMRSAAKSFNFGIPYGMGLGSLAILLTGKNTPQTRDEAAEKMEDYFKNQPKTRQFFTDIKESAKVNGYTKTAFGRRRYYTFTDKDGNVDNGRMAAALRQAGNAVIQGCLEGNTRIQTKEFGIVKIKDVEGMHLQVWDGDKWSNGDILYSGKKRKCIVTFNNGQKFICSPTHKFLVKSAKGNERFVECQDLATKDNAKNPHRIVINREYCASDNIYSSEWAYKYDSAANNSNNAYLDNIYSSFDAGVVLGRLASDGTIGLRKEGASYVLNYVAEHEKNILPEMRRCLEFLGDVKEHKCERDGRNEAIYRLYIYSKSLTKEVTDLDVKHKIHDKIFADTEMLRGFLRGLFDGDGGISGKTIALTFGTQSNFEEMCRDVQKALMFFGIRSRYYVYPDRSKITIKTNDNARFMELIGFINEHKNDAGNALECIRDEHLFGRVLIPESVEITDEYIDMYDVCNTDGGYYVADGIITHNTAADVFKISVARNFSWIRANKLLGLVLIINMIHDEQLMEIDAQHLNVQRALAEIGHNMQFDIDGFPPLYIGAGVGKAWGYAKGKMAEIHPVLLQQYTEEARAIDPNTGKEVMPLWLEKENWDDPVDTNKVLDYFEKRVIEFRRKKVADYITDPSHYGDVLHPAIAGLINLQFNYGRGDDAKAYTGPNGEKYDDAEFLKLNLTDFIKENHLDVDPDVFKKTEHAKEEEPEDDSYDDNDDGEDGEFELDEADDIYSFSKIDESDKIYGSSIRDLVSVFKACVLEHQKVVALDTRDLYFRKLDAIADFLNDYVVDETEPGNEDACQIVFLTDGNVMKYTGIYVKGITQELLERVYKLIISGKNLKESDFTAGDVKTRSQAK